MALSILFGLFVVWLNYALRDLPGVAPGPLPEPFHLNPEYCVAVPDDLYPVLADCVGGTCVDEPVRMAGLRLAATTGEDRYIVWSYVVPSEYADTYPEEGWGEGREAIWLVTGSLHAPARFSQIDRNEYVDIDNLFARSDWETRWESDRPGGEFPVFGTPDESFCRRFIECVELGDGWCREHEERAATILAERHAAGLSNAAALCVPIPESFVDSVLADLRYRPTGGLAGEPEAWSDVDGVVFVGVESHPYVHVVAVHANGEAESDRAALFYLLVDGGVATPNAIRWLTTPDAGLHNPTPFAREVRRAFPIPDLAACEAAGTISGPHPLPSAPPLSPPAGEPPAMTVPTSRPAPPMMTTTTEASRAVPDDVAVLAAHDDGIDLVQGSESIPVLRGAAVAAAFPDGRGGIVYQRVQDPIPDWEWDDERLQRMPVWSDGIEPVPIEWIPAIGEEARVLIPADREAEIVLQGVSVVDGRSVVLYRTLAGIPDPCSWIVAEADPDPETDWCMWVRMHSVQEHLEAQDLDGDQTWYLGVVAGFEDVASVSVGGDYAAIMGPSQHEWPTTIGIADINRLLALERNDWVASICPDDCLMIEPQERCLPDTSVGLEVTAAAFSPDGSEIAYAGRLQEACPGAPEGLELVVVDVGTGEETGRFAVGDHSGAARGINFGHDYILVDAYGPDGFLISADGEVAYLPPATHHSLWHTAEGP